MLGKHDEEKYKFIGLWVHHDLLNAINRTRGELGRSQFMRDAISEKIESINKTSLPREIVAAPDRAGKGGPRTAKYPSLLDKGSELNDKPSSKPTKEQLDKMKDIAREVLGQKTPHSKP